MFLLQASSDICMIRLDFIDGTISEPEGNTPHKIIVVFAFTLVFYFTDN